MMRAGALAAVVFIAGPVWPQQRDYLEALRRIRSGDSAGAVITLRAVIRSHPGFARAYTRLSGLAPAELLDRAPDSAFDYFARGVARAAQKDFPGGEGDLRKCVELAPGFLPAYAELVQISNRQRTLNQLAGFLESLPSSTGTQYALGYLHFFRSDWRKSEDYLDRAARAEPRSWEIADARYFVYYRTDRFPDALALLARMLAQAEEEGDLEWKGRVLGRAGMIHVDQGEYERASGELAEAVTVARDLGNRSGEAVFLGNLAAAYLNSGKYAAALSEARQAIVLARELKNRRDEGRNLSIVAAVHAETAEYNTAIREFTEAIEIAREAKDSASEADQHASLALLHSTLGDSDRALGSIRASIALAESLDNPWLSGRFLQILGSVQRARGNPAQARESYERAIAIARKIGDRPGEALRLAYAGEVDLAAGNRAAALARFERALSLADAMGAPAIQTAVLNDLADWYYRNRSMARARELYERSLEIARAVRQPEPVWRAHAGLAGLMEQTRRGDALDHYRQAVAAIEQMRGSLVIAEEKAGFLDDKIRVFQRYVAALVPAGGTAEAFRVAEQSRARALLDLIAESRSGSRKDVDAGQGEARRDIEARLARLQARLLGEQGKEQPDTARVAALERELSSAEDRHLALRREIREKHPAFADFDYPEPADPRAVQDQLGSRSLLLEYAAGENGSFLFAAGRREFRVFRLPSEGRLAEHVRALRAAIAVGPSRSQAAAYILHARALYDELVAPAAALLVGKDHLIIVPDGILRYLPFEVLLGPKGDDAYLVRDFAISYAPSAGVLMAVRRRLRSAPQGPVSLIAFGDPDYGSRPAANLAPAVAPLRHSRREVEAIAGLYPAGRRQVLLGRDADKERVKSLRTAGRRTLLHFSAHAVLNERRPQFSGLVLSGGGLLQVYEVMNLDLELEMVVLSACETGLGKDVRGEGLTGLTQAFLYAGAPAVLVSLWKVDDRSTAELMIGFHRFLREAKLGKAEALRHAQLELIQGGEFRHPYYWAPFVITGDGS